MTEIRMIRKKKGMSEGQLSKESGVSYSYLSRIERGWVIPSFETAERLGNTLEVNAENLFPETILKRRGI